MKKVLFTLISVVWVCVIFSFSLEPAEISREKSLNIVEKINKCIEAIEQHPVVQQIPLLQHKEPFRLTQKHVRKTAHFLEYMVLGILLYITFNAIGLKNTGILIIWLAGVLVAVLDETIQNFMPGRGPQILDVFLDAVGVGLGIILADKSIYKLLRKNITNHVK